MTGETIKKVLADNKRQMKDIAELLGTSLSNLSAGLSKSDIKTGLLEKISEAAGIPICVFYGDEYGAPQEAPAHDESTLELLKMKDEQLTLAMKQTSTAQDQMTEVLSQMREVIKSIKPQESPLSMQIIQPTSSPVTQASGYTRVTTRGKRKDPLTSSIAKKLTDKPKF